MTRTPTDDFGDRHTNQLILRSLKNVFFNNIKDIILFYNLILRALSLIGRVPNCRLGWSQFESGRAREIYALKEYVLF